MSTVQYSQIFTFNTSAQPVRQQDTPRWQTVAMWAAGISAAALGLGLAAYAYRSGWFSSEESCFHEITCTEDSQPDQILPFQSAINGTLPCEEGETDQTWLVCEEAASPDAPQLECAILKNVCTSGAERREPFLLSAGSKALTCALNAGGKAGKAALTALGSACYQTGRLCVKGLLAAKVSHETLGTPDPNYHITMYLSGTPFRCLTHDARPFFRYLGVRI